MKTDDIFEAITDIDDRFIAEARPTDLTDDQTVIAYPAVKKPIWRTLVPAAACVTALAAAGAFGVKYFGGRGVQPSNSTVSNPASLNEFLYPEEAKYIVDKEITRFNFAYASSKLGNPSAYDDIADYAESYDELAAKSDLIVAGTFIDVIHQTQDFEEIFHSSYNCVSYNSLEVDKVLKGNVEEKDIITICQNSSIGAGTDIVYNFFVGDQLSPMLKGDKWIYFLKKDENGIYSPVNGPQGRYPLPNYTNTFITCDGMVATVDKFGAHANAAPARDEIYATLLRLLDHNLTEPVIHLNNSQGEFKIDEFSDKTFEIIDGRVVMSDITNPDAMTRPVISGIDFYLTDLNGDGKCEICSWGSIGSGIVSHYITVYDIANNEFYFMHKRPSDKLFSLDLNDGLLYVVTSEYYPNNDKEISREPLSLDVLEKVTRTDTAYEEIPLFFDQTFTMDDFPGFTFAVDTRTDYPIFSFGRESESVTNNVTAVYFCDIDGDGKREIALNCPFAGLGTIRVYGVMDNGEIGCAEYYENGGCYLSGAEDGTPEYYTNDKIEPFKFSKSDLKPTFAQGYSYQLLDWDHSLDFTEILPSLGGYRVMINDRMLKIKHGGEKIFDSGIWLQDLYSIPDKENNSVILVYITGDVGGDVGMVGAVKLSENFAERYDFEKGVTIKPTTDALLLVNEDGSETPFTFPKSGAVPLL